MDIQELKDHAIATMLREGACPSILFVEGEGGIIPAAFFGEPTDDRMFTTGERFAKLPISPGKLLNLAIVHEGWTVFRSDEQVRENGKPMARDEADRVRVLVIAQLNVVTNETEVVIFEVKQLGKHIDLLETELGKDVDSGYFEPLHSFVRGYCMKPKNRYVS